MKKFKSHISKNLLAGAVAILPVGGLIITVGYMESAISGSGISSLPFYFPGLGLIVTLLFIYFIGMVLTTVVGRWVWSRMDRLLQRLPALGRLYQTLKQVLGYGEGENAIFQEAVLVQSRDYQSEELGLVKNRVMDETGNERLIIFIPGVLNPTTGRLIMMDRDAVKPLAMPVSETLKALVSMGKAKIDLRRLKSSGRCP